MREKKIYKQTGEAVALQKTSHNTHEQHNNYKNEKREYRNRHADTN